MSQEHGFLYFMKEMWNDYRTHILVTVCALTTIVLGGGIYRVSTGAPFWGAQESKEEKQTRLIRCAEVSGSTPTLSEQNDGENRGVCSGFSKDEIENAQKMVESR